MAIGEHWEISLDRQKEIAKIANRKRRYFSAWQRQQIAIWRRAIEAKKELPEQQRFFMRDIELALIEKGFLKPEQKSLL